MPRVARLDVGGYPYHVINRAVMRLPIFSTASDYRLFEDLLFETAEETGMRILAYCIMPNHWHLLLYPEQDGDLGRFMHRLTNAHTRRFRVLTRTIGTGPLYQGRYKSFIIEDDKHLLTVFKYVERNAVRASLSRTAEEWRWGSAYHRTKGTRPFTESPTPLPEPYIEWINTRESSEELKELRTSVNKTRPFGRDSWVDAMVLQFNLGATTRNPGRPRK